MTTKMRTFIDTHKWMTGMDIEQAAENGELIVEKTIALGQYINEMGDNAEQIILQNVSEEEIAEALNSLIATLAGAMFMQGKVGPYMTILSDEDNVTFIHTLALSFVGMLMDEEIV